MHSTGELVVKVAFVQNDRQPASFIHALQMDRNPSATSSVVCRQAQTLNSVGCV